MGKHILYVANYYLEDVIEQRNSKPFISQAGQNKSQYIIDMLEHGGNQVTVWSNAWTDSRSLKKYKGFQSKINEQVYYADITGAPVLNALSCLKSSKMFLKEYVKKNQIDAIIFYNMRLETSKLALYAKKKFQIPIILQYEDGLTTDATIGGLKRIIYQNMERNVLQAIDGAFLVNGKIKVPCSSVVIRGAIREKQQEQQQNQQPVNSSAEEKIPRLLFASTLDRQRGAELLIEALQYTKADFTLTITGRGESEEKIKNCKDSRVRFLGYLDYETYKKELKETDICVNAQLAHHEFGNFSFPSKIFEYLSAGKLVISSDVADAEEALGDTLLIYHNDDPKKLAKAIEKAIRITNSEEESAIYQQRIRDVIRENSMDAVSARVNQMLNQICE